MHYISTLMFLMTIIIVINARSFHHRSCPEEYRELRRRNDESNSDSDEDICEQAMDRVARQHNSIQNQYILRQYCPYYDEAMDLEKENNDAICEDKKKRQIDIKRKRQEAKKKRNYNDDSSDSNDNDNDDDDDDDKRRGLKKRELHKRLALRFLHKRMP